MRKFVVATIYGTVNVKHRLSSAFMLCVHDGKLVICFQVSDVSSDIVFVRTTVADSLLLYSKTICTGTFISFKAQLLLGHYV